MKNIYAYSIVDGLSESIISTFYCPNARMAYKQFSNFCDDLKKKSGDDSIDSWFALYQSDSFLSVPETISEVEGFSKVDSDGLIATGESV